jgi:hypothetical protein
VDRHLAIIGAAAPPQDSASDAEALMLQLTRRRPPVPAGLDLPLPGGAGAAGSSTVEPAALGTASMPGPAPVVPSVPERRRSWSKALAGISVFAPLRKLRRNLFGGRA